MADRGFTIKDQLNAVGVPLPQSKISDDDDSNSEVEHYFDTVYDSDYDAGESEMIVDSLV